MYCCTFKVKLHPDKAPIKLPEVVLLLSWVLPSCSGVLPSCSGVLLSCTGERAGFHS